MAKEKDSVLASLAKRVERAKNEGDPTEFLTEGFESDFAIILGGCISFSDQIPEIEQKRIIKKVAYSTALERPVTRDSLIKACKHYESLYLKRPLTTFRFLTEISLRFDLDVANVKVDDVYLTFNPKQIRAINERNKLLVRSKHSLNYDLPKGYMRLSAVIKARSTYEAAEKCLNSIDLLRATWNLAINKGKIWRSFGSATDPVNDIRLTPFHTLHLDNGLLATEEFWYEPSYISPAKIFYDKNKFKQIQNYSKKIRLKLSKLAYKKDIESALVRYVRAFDSSDPNNTFLRLWSILEYLTASTELPSEVTIRRTAFLYTDRETNVLILTNLANYRNKFVHAGTESDDLESLVFQLKKYVEGLFQFHIGNNFKFNTRYEASDFMNLPYVKDELHKKILRMQQALSFIADT